MAKCHSDGTFGNTASSTVTVYRFCWRETMPPMEKAEEDAKQIVLQASTKIEYFGRSLMQGI